MMGVRHLQVPQEVHRQQRTGLRLVTVEAQLNADDVRVRAKF
jgi:hypothetical protein